LQPFSDGASGAADLPFASLVSLEFTAMNVRPLHDRIVVRRLEESAQQQIGAIIIPDSAKEKPQQGKVLAVGLGKTNEDGARVPLDVKAGDTILFGKYSGQEIKLDGVEYLIMKEDDVLAIEDAAAAMKGATAKAGAAAKKHSKA
jgi:chaperonin GroES